MRPGGLALVASCVLLAACAERSRPAETAPTSPPVVTVAPSAPASPQPQPVPAPAPPVVVTPAPTGPRSSPAPSSAPPSAERPEPSLLFVSVARANLRQAPDLKARILAVLTKGTKLAVLEKSPQWYRVRLDDGKEGWVAESVTSTKPD